MNNKRKWWWLKWIEFENSYWKVKQILIYFIEKKWSKYFKKNNISNNNKNNMKESFNNIIIKKW